MSKKIYLLIFVLLTVYASAENKHIIFVVDNSGSCWSKGNTNKQQATDAMMKNARVIYTNEDVSSMLVGKMDECEGKEEISTDFVDNLKDFRSSIESIKENNGNDSIVSGFKAAQKKMINNKYEGHIYLVGDCDGLDYCGGIKNYAKNLLKEGKLTPFTYLFTAGCTGKERDDWNSLVSELNDIKEGVAATFNYEKIVAQAKKKKEVELKKQYFTNIVFLNKDASKNDGMNIARSPWRCIESDGLKWLVIDKKEQKLDFFMQEPKTNAFYKKTKDNVLISDFIGLLNSENTCGRKDWRLPDLFELRRLTQLGPNHRNRLFPYIKIWPHISITGGKFSGYRKGIDLNNGKKYEYREDRPYAAMFVAGNIDTSLFEPPIEFLARYKITNKTITSVKPKEKIDDVIDEIEFSPQYDVEKDKWVVSNLAVISGINTTVPVRVISNGEIKINEGAWVTEGDIENGDKLQLRHKSSIKEDTETRTIIAIGLKTLKFVSKTKVKTLITPIEETDEVDDEPYSSIIDAAGGL
jgi:hypothetical protein